MTRRAASWPAGGEPEDRPHRSAGHRQAGAREAVGGERQRHLDEEAGQDGEGDEGEEALVRQAEVVADLRPEHAEDGPVELVDGVQPEQDQQGKAASPPVISRR
jgi:hypothetical protein